MRARTDETRKYHREYQRAYRAANLEKTRAADTAGARVRRSANREQYNAYMRGNVWVISWRANRLKSDATLHDLRCLVAAIEARMTP